MWNTKIKKKNFLHNFKGYFIKPYGVKSPYWDDYFIFRNVKWFSITVESECRITLKKYILCFLLHWEIACLLICDTFPKSKFNNTCYKNRKHKYVIRMKIFYGVKLLFQRWVLWKNLTMHSQDFSFYKRFKKLKSMYNSQIWIIRMKHKQQLLFSFM